MSPPSPFWSALDAAVVINLDHRTDRWEAMRSHLAQVAPMDKVHRLPAVRGVDLPGYGDKRWFGRTKRPTTWAGRAGITLSQRNALRLMLGKGWRRMLILEDDARFAAPVDGPAGAALAAHWERAGEAPEATFLGFTEPRGPAAPVCALDAKTALFRIGGCLCAHAYVVNAAAARALLARLPGEDAQVWDWLARHNAVDTFYARHMAGCCAVTAVSPVWVEQAEFQSDIAPRMGGTAQGDARLADLRARPLARLREDAAMWLKWKLRRIRGF